MKSDEPKYSRSFLTFAYLVVLGTLMYTIHLAVPDSMAGQAANMHLRSDPVVQAGRRSQRAKYQQMLTESNSMVADGYEDAEQTKTVKTFMEQRESRVELASRKVDEVLTALHPMGEGEKVVLQPPKAARPPQL